MVEARFASESSTSLLKVKETMQLWLEKRIRVGTPAVCHDPVEPMKWRHLNVFNKECGSSARCRGAGVATTARCTV